MRRDVPGRSAGRGPRRLPVLVAALAMAASAAGVGAARALDTPPCGGADWTMYQHDVARTGAACPGGAITTADASTLTYRWFARTGGAVTASPTVVGDTVYVGDGAGSFYAFDAGTGQQRWVVDITKYDHHNVSYGEIVSSAAYFDDPVNGPTLFVGGGGSVFALRAADGKVVWHTDTDPTSPASPAEVESSPLVYTPTSGSPDVVVGTDVNESTGQHATGLLVLDAATGSPVWKFNPEHPGQLLRGADAVGPTPGYGCGDVWSSPGFDAEDGLFVFATGNCPDPTQAAAAGVDVPSEAVWAITTAGRPVWVFSQAAQTDTAAGTDYGGNGGDDDFGAAPIVTRTPDGRHPMVVAASKAGFVFGLRADETIRVAGAPYPAPQRVWYVQAAQPGQLGGGPGAVGGFIGSGALGPAAPGGGCTAGPWTGFFGATAVPVPFQRGGATSPDATLLADPTRAASLHGVNVADGSVCWQQPVETASYAPTTYSGGVLFAPSTTSFAAEAYDASTGTPLWAAPTGGAPSSGVAVVGPDIFYGAGTSFQAGSTVPPQPTGVWSFGLPGR